MTDADAPTTSTFPLEGYATFERRRITLSDAGVELDLVHMWAGRG